MKIEVCANSYISAVNAENAGADRIELCAELAVGGITPSHGTILKVRQDVKLPLHVLIRPRSGDFTYSNSDFDIMKHDVLYCKEMNCQGIVSGILKQDQTVDMRRMDELIELAKPMSFTFHRAFDWVENQEREIENLIHLGVDRVLSAGQSSMAIRGLKRLIELQKWAKDGLIIMPGGGINIENILEFKNEGFLEVHFSAVTLHKTQKKVTVAMNNEKLFLENQIAISDYNKIREIISLVK